MDDGDSATELEHDRLEERMDGTRAIFVATCKLVQEDGARRPAATVQSWDLKHSFWVWAGLGHGAADYYQ